MLPSLITRSIDTRRLKLGRPIRCAANRLTPATPCDVAAQRSRPSCGLSRDHNWTIRLTGSGLGQGRLCFCIEAVRAPRRRLDATTAPRNTLAPPTTGADRIGDCADGVPMHKKSRREFSPSRQNESCELGCADPGARASMQQRASLAENFGPRPYGWSEEPSAPRVALLHRKRADDQPIRSRPWQPAFPPWSRFRPRGRRAVAALSRAGLRTSA
jgi:hypothetical protein